MQKAFTMIELVFVIVILGILAAVALPRIVATRDDAKIATLSANIMSAVSDVANYTLSSNKIESNLSKMSNTIKGWETSGVGTIHTDSNSTDIKVGTTSDCIILSIVDSDGGNTKIIKTAYGATTNSLCIELQKVIKAKSYPMKIKGKGVVF